WAYLVGRSYLKYPSDFINPVPHMSFVWGETNTAFLKKRFEAMVKHPLFEEMQFSEDRKQLQQWMPLIMEGRDPAEKVAATFMEAGTDVNFGSLTRCLFKTLTNHKDVNMHLSHEVKRLRKQNDGTWQVLVKDNEKDRKKIYNAK